MTNCLLCSVGRHCLKLLFLLALLLTTSFACAGDVPVPVPVDNTRQEQVDSLEKARHKERMDRVKANLQEINHKHQSVGLSDSKARSVMRLATLLMILLNWGITKIAKQKNEVGETDEEKSSENEAHKERPVANVADLGMRSKMILRMLLLAAVWGIGVALFVGGGKEFFYWWADWQSLIAQGVDPKEFLWNKLMVNGFCMVAGAVLQLVGVWYFFRIRTLLRRADAGFEDEVDELAESGPDGIVESDDE